MIHQENYKKSTRIGVSPKNHTELNVVSMLGPSRQLQVQSLDLTKLWSLICHNYCQVVNIKKSQQELQQRQHTKL